MTNPNDAIRKTILQYFYDRNSSATSRFGKKGSAVRISDVKAQLKDRAGLTQQQVMSNLTYLIDQGWIKTIDQEKTVVVKGGTVPSVVTFYEISAAGIDKIEAEKSEFTPAPAFSGINVTALGTNVITLGDGNVVNAHHEALRSHLDDLENCLKGALELTELQKLEVVADIESLKTQLAKETPDHGVARSLWESIDRAAALAGAVDLATKIGTLMGGVLM